MLVLISFGFKTGRHCLRWQASGFGIGSPLSTRYKSILYRADGTRFRRHHACPLERFSLRATSSNIRPGNVHCPCQTVVTQRPLGAHTTASAGAQYNITYAGGGVNQFRKSGPSAKHPEIEGPGCSPLSTGYGGWGRHPSPAPHSNQRRDGYRTRSPSAPRRCGLQQRPVRHHQQAGQIDAATGKPGRLHPCRRQLRHLRRSCRRDPPCSPTRKLPAVPSTDPTPRCSKLHTLTIDSLILFRNGPAAEAWRRLRIAGNIVTFFTGPFR